MVEHLRLLNELNWFILIQFISFSWLSSFDGGRHIHVHWLIGILLAWSSGILVVKFAPGGFGFEEFVLISPLARVLLFRS